MMFPSVANIHDMFHMFFCELLLQNYPWQKTLKIAW